MDIPSASLLEWPVFTPIFGFTSVSAPELTIEAQPIQEANWFFPKHVIKNGGIGPISLSRGVTFVDADFYVWMVSALSGNKILNVGGVSPRRSFLLIHFFQRSLIGADLKVGPFEFAARVPARAFLLKNCIPTRYKSGTDYSAQDGSISLAEIELQPEGMEEINLAVTGATIRSRLTG